MENMRERGAVERERRAVVICWIRSASSGQLSIKQIQSGAYRHARQQQQHLQLCTCLIDWIKTSRQMAVSLAGQAVVEPPPPTQPKKKMMKWSFRSVIIRTNVTETFVILCCGHVTYKASSPAGHIERDSFILLKNIFSFIFFSFWLFVRPAGPFLWAGLFWPSSWHFIYNRRLCVVCCWPYCCLKKEYVSRCAVRCCAYNALNKIFQRKKKEKPLRSCCRNVK